MNKLDVIERLSRATDKAAVFAVQRGSIKPLPEKLVAVGSVFIQKTRHGLYNIVDKYGEILFYNISVFDVAIIIAQRYSAGQNNIVKQVVYLESCFSKHHTDMMHYLNCMKGAKAKADHERMMILEDKFQTSELRAKAVRDEISLFKRVK